MVLLLVHFSLHFTLAYIPIPILRPTSKPLLFDYRTSNQWGSKQNLSDLETSSTLLDPPCPDNKHFSSQSTVAPELLPGSRAIQQFLSRPQVEIVDSALVIISTFLAAVYTLPSLPYHLAAWDVYMEDIISYLFGLEFLLRWYGIGQLSGRFLLKPLSLIDILVVLFPLSCSQGLIPISLLPSWLSSNSGLINLRLLRILRLQRVLTDMTTFTQFEVSLGLNASDIRPYQLQLARVVLSIFTLLSVASGLIYSAEHDVNPNIPDYFTALYFGLTTLTTVGFGDITPVTVQGRLVVCASILVGIAVLPIQSAGLVEALLDFQKEREGKRRIQPPSDELWNKETWIEDVDSVSSLSGVCRECGTSTHRRDALYCWNCGSKLSGL
jgi:voltage-gated potassium channel